MVIGSPDIGHPPGHMEGLLTIPLDLAGSRVPMGSMGGHNLAGALVIHIDWHREPGGRWLNPAWGPNRGRSGVYAHSFGGNIVVTRDDTNKVRYSMQSSNQVPGLDMGAGGPCLLLGVHFPVLARWGHHASRGGQGLGKHPYLAWFS